MNAVSPAIPHILDAIRLMFGDEHLDTDPSAEVLLTWLTRIEWKGQLHVVLTIERPLPGPQNVPAAMAAQVARNVLNLYQNLFVPQREHLHLYVEVEGVWNEILFPDWKPVLMASDYVDEPADSPAFGAPRFVPVPEHLFTLPPLSDDEAHPFQYWWLTTQSEAWRKQDAALARRLADRCGQMQETTVRFGELEHVVWERQRAKGVFAVTLGALHMKLAAAQADAATYRGKMPIAHGYNDWGWCTFIFLADGPRAVCNHATYLEEGEHGGEDFEHGAICVDFLKSAGFEARDTDDGGIRFDLPTEVRVPIDPAFPPADAFLRRGSHTFMVDPAAPGVFVGNAADVPRYLIA